jgi:hypothetical protein
VQVEHGERQQVAATVVLPHKDLGANHLESRISVLKEMYFKVRLANERPEKRQEEARLVEKLDERPAVSRDCLNCVSFVYEDEDLGFPMSRQPVTYFGRILSIVHMLRDILQQVVSYLNGRGGVLLVGVQRV